MSKVPFFCSLYVSHPPIPKQKLFHNNVTTYLINLSEYVIASPCKYPSYLASLSLRLHQVHSSTLQKVTLVAFWLIFAVFHKSLWKLGVCLVCVKLINRAGFSKPVSPPQVPSKVPPHPLSPSPLRPPKVKKEDASKPKIPSPGLDLSSLSPEYGTLKISATSGGEPSTVSSSFCLMDREGASQSSFTIGSFFLVSNPEEASWIEI